MPYTLYVNPCNFTDNYRRQFLIDYYVITVIGFTGLITNPSNLIEFLFVNFYSYYSIYFKMG